MSERQAAPVPPTAEDLLAVDQLELSLLSGRPEAPFTAVRSAEDPAARPWLKESDLRLSSGPLESGGAALTPPPSVLVYGLTPKRRTPPPQLSSLAGAAGTTLLVAPPAVPLSRVEGAALKLLARAAHAASELLASPQGYLLAAFESPKPERELLERVHLLTGVDLLLLTPWGEVQARAGRSGWRPPRSAGGAAVADWREGETKHGGRSALTLKLTQGGRLRGVLVAFDPPRFALPLIELCRTLLISSALSRSAAARHDRAALTALLAEWLAAPQAAANLQARLEAAGVAGESPYLVAACEVGPRLAAGRAAEARHRHQLELLREAGEEYFRSLGSGVLSETRGEQCVLVFAVASPREHAPKLLRALKAAAGAATVRLGVSLPREDLTGVADAYHQALLALQSMTQREGLAWFDELDPVYWVLKQQPRGNLEALRDRLVGAVKGADPHGRLWRTLVAYIRAPGDMRALASELNVHVNTLRYRLARIEEIIQEPLSRPETIAKLYLALQIDAMLRRGD